MALSQEDMYVIVGHIQQILDDSCFSGEAYIRDEEPYVIRVLIKEEVMNEPGTCGRYPFYQSKGWLLEKVETFVTAPINDMLDLWGEYDCLREHTVEPVNVGRDGDSCQLLVSYRVA